MRIQETLYVLAEEGDGRANLILDITKGRKNRAFFFSKEDDISHGEYYLTKDDKNFNPFLKKKKLIFSEMGDLD